MTRRKGERPTGPSGRPPVGGGHGDDRSWDAHRDHVPDEFQQATRRADFRGEGEHDDEAAAHQHGRQMPERRLRPKGPLPTDRMTPPQRAARAHELREPVVAQGQDHLPHAYAGTSGYDDYEAEALYGTAYRVGDWPRRYQREARRNHSGRGPLGYRRSDERLLEDACQRLSDDPDIDARGLSLTCDDGIVRIEGEVAERWQKHHVEHLVAHCHGLRDIDNRIRVAPRKQAGPA